MHVIETVADDIAGVGEEGIYVAKETPLADTEQEAAQTGIGTRNRDKNTASFISVCSPGRELAR